MDLSRLPVPGLGLLLFLWVSDLAPAASAIAGDNDSLTRTWSTPLLADIESQDGGVGIHSPDQACPTSVNRLQGAAPSAFYYSDQRQTTNLEPGAFLLSAPHVPLDQPCPLPGSAPGPQSLVLGDVQVEGPHPALSVDQLVCTKEPTAVCLVDPWSASATLFRCNSPTFTPAPADGKGVPTDGMAMSRSISCGSTSNEVGYHDGGPQGRCDSWTFDTGGWGTGCALPVADLVPLDGTDQTGYVVACMQANALVVDSATFPSISYTDSFSSHDYILVLDADGTPERWSDAQQAHWGLAGHPLQGWHDLGGNNGCPAHGLPQPPPSTVPACRPPYPFPCTEYRLDGGRERIVPFGESVTWPSDWTSASLAGAVTLGPTAVDTAGNIAIGINSLTGEFTVHRFGDALGTHDADVTATVHWLGSSYTIGTRLPSATVDASAVGHVTFQPRLTHQGRVLVNGSIEGNVHYESLFLSDGPVGVGPVQDDGEIRLWVTIPGQHYEVRQAQGFPTMPPPLGPGEVRVPAGGAGWTFPFTYKEADQNGSFLFTGAWESNRHTGTTFLVNDLLVEAQGMPQAAKLDLDYAKKGGRDWTLRVGFQAKEDVEDVLRVGRAGETLLEAFNPPTSWDLALGVTSSDPPSSVPVGVEPSYSEAAQAAGKEWLDIQADFAGTRSPDEANWPDRLDLAIHLGDVDLFLSDLALRFHAEFGFVHDEGGAAGPTLANILGETPLGESAASLPALYFRAHAAIGADGAGPGPEILVGKLRLDYEEVPVVEAERLHAAKLDTRPKAPDLASLEAKFEPDGRLWVGTDDFNLDLAASLGGTDPWTIWAKFQVMGEDAFYADLSATRPAEFTLSRGDSVDVMLHGVRSFFVDTTEGTSLKASLADGSFDIDSGSNHLTGTGVKFFQVSSRDLEFTWGLVVGGGIEVDTDRLDASMDAGTTTDTITASLRVLEVHTGWETLSRAGETKLVKLLSPSQTPFYIQATTLPS